ncbi:hypothetical protein SUGI_0407110 [Cryptomeria japonica]|nr:hypothetical protein SUGI_0407110 [Cryptomeria japonica]
MLRTRILSFAAGFTVTGVAIAQFAWKELWSTHAAFSSQVQEYYDALERRVERFEAHISPPPASTEESGVSTGS